MRVKSESVACCYNFVIYWGLWFSLKLTLLNTLLGHERCVIRKVAQQGVLFLAECALVSAPVSLVEDLWHGV